MKVRIRAEEFYPVFILEDVEPNEKEDELTVTLSTKEVAQIRKTMEMWDKYQEKLRAMHPWF